MPCAPGRKRGGVTSGKTVEITFDGTDEAEVTGPKGDTFEVPLVCVAIGS
jgi:hypothetical protein